jgi:hypothetical protein
MSNKLMQRARLLACHAWVFRTAAACEYDALAMWFYERRARRIE